MFASACAEAVESTSMSPTTSGVRSTLRIASEALLSFVAFDEEKFSRFAWLMVNSEAVGVGTGMAAVMPGVTPAATPKSSTMR